ncbi:uncharacterized protein LOC133863330 [Alnus glutinosa]|uniref:uncharacterized protein LOC133863330 n=1 Tax=Alnus glutinosa TaxID=3517 RepID=UPI002D76CE63|nr:uncharacterized protein LOC133863330 [Alnus glutinosa]
MDQSEKVQGTLRNNGQMEDFKRVIHAWLKFTWSNKWESGIFVKERLDRALVNPAWCGIYPNASVEVLPVTTLNHKSLWLRFNPNFRRAPKLFRFEAWWNVVEDCGTVINQAWNSTLDGSNSMEEAKLKLSHC